VAQFVFLRYLCCCCRYCAFANRCECSSRVHTRCPGVGDGNFPTLGCCHLPTVKFTACLLAVGANATLQILAVVCVVGVVGVVVVVVVLVVIVVALSLWLLLLLRLLLLLPLLLLVLLLFVLCVCVCVCLCVCV